MRGRRPAIIWWALLLSLIRSVLTFWWRYIAGDLPEVTISSLTSIPQKTIITDRHGETLYTFFEQDRKYVAYEDIPPHLLMAFISSEDRQYREHDGVDKWWIARALVNNIKRKFFDTSLSLQWASTISQQLIKNTYLTADRSLKRKLQEVHITRKVHNMLEKNYTDEFPDYEESKIQLLVKKKILELYTNLIFLGNNSYGIWTAAKHYFNKDVQELTLLESAILAGLPQAPSWYNPLVNKTNMMWDWQISDGTNTYFLDQESSTSETFLSQIQKNIASKYASYDSNVDDPQWIDRFWKGNFVNNDILYRYTYSPGRKDYVLRAMYQEWYINQDELVKAFIDGVDYEFSSYTYNIKAPHFVFFVRDFLLHNPLFESLDLNLNDLLQWWYTIRTSLDMQKQRVAELASDETRQNLLSQWWSSRSLLHIDNNRWEILTYLGSADYFDAEIDGQYDLIHARRQQWSTLKPFVYAKLLENYPLGIDGKINDNPISGLTWPKPNNADGQFTWRKTLSWALNNSRNLTAIRAFLANGWETIMKEFLISIGLTNIIPDHFYGWTLTLWTAEESIYHLAQAYLQLSSPNDIVPTINPILSITGPYGENVYTNTVTKTPRVISKGNAYQIRTILRNRAEVSPWWRNFVTYTWLGPYAVKTWTTDVKKNKVTYPKDGYVVLYTPNDTLLSRAGNVDSKPLHSSALGSTITKPFVQSYINSLWTWAFLQTVYDRPNDLTSGNVYKHTQYNSIPKEIQTLLRR